MRPILIATGNPLRHDDGVAHAVIERLHKVASRELIQLTPELAADIASYDAVIFIDADLQTDQPVIEPLEPILTSAPFTHISGPSEILALSTHLFGFKGRGYVCRIPARDLSPGEGLSPQAAAGAEQAAQELTALIHRLG
jgi:hydrogenase maturation protease